MQLRPYQQQAIENLRNAYRSGARAPLLVMPTGAGKTATFSVITAGAVSRGRRVLILVHRRELIRQASGKLSQVDVPHGIIAAGHPTEDHPVQIASVQTLVRRMAALDWNPDLIVIDEAHHASAGSWASVLEHWPHALRLGVTATPQRLDGRGLAGTFDRLVVGPSVASLIAAGYLTGARIYAPPMKADLRNLPKRGGDFAVGDASERMNRPTVTGDAIDHYNRLAAGQPAIAFCCTTRHAESVAAAFRAAGYRAETLLGSTDPIRREQLVQELAAGQVQVLVTVDVVSEGFDCPGAAVAILLRPTQSESLYLQQVGRVLRPAPSKPHALILDHVGNVHRHGWPDDDREWTLDDARRRNRSGGPPAPSVRTCPSCFAAFRPQLLCPVCGAYCAPEPRRELKQVAGELEELRRAEARDRRREQGRAQTLQELIRVGQERGMKNPVGWARHVHHARQAKSGT